MGCFCWLLSSGFIFGFVNCEVFEGLLWRYTTFVYPCASVMNYFFLYAKQATVKGPNPTPLMVILSKVFLVLVSCVPFIALGYLLFLIKAER